MPQRVQLIQGAGFGFLWAAAREWFARASREALAGPAPWVVLTGGRPMAHALKARLLAEGTNLGAVYFWSPGDARDFLRRALAQPPELVVREHAHLLLALAAESIERAPREPARVLRALDRVQAAGLAAGALEYPPVERLAGQLEKDLSDAGWVTKQQLDWRLAERPPEGLIAHLLVAGFDGAHFESWPLLQAAVRCSREALVLLTAPRSKAEWLDQAWIGTWEEQFGGSETGSTDVSGTPFAPLAQRMEFGAEHAAEQPAPRPAVRIGRTLQEQAEAVAAQLILFAAEPAATRIAALFPGRGPLAREVSARLLARGVPHYDAFGFLPPPDPALARWAAWSALQRTPTLAGLHRLLDQPHPLGPAVPEGLFDTLKRAAGDVLVDDLAVLGARLKDMGAPEALDAARFIELFRPLPARNTLALHFEQTCARWTALGWSDLLTALDSQWRTVAPFGGREASLGQWLDWLDSAAPVAAPVRAPHAANPFALIHLLPYAQAEGLDWSHLVLAGLNEGHWPPPAEADGFLTDDRVGMLNKAALRQGRQGEGHWTLQPGRSLMLGASEQRELQRRQFFNLVEGVTSGLALTASLEADGDSGRLLPASDFLSHAFFTATGAPLTGELMREIQALTSGWLAAWPAAPHIAGPRQPVPIERTGQAFRARRAPAPFGSFECAFERAPPPKPAQLTCKKWETAIRDPARVWMETFLSVAPPDDLRDLDLWPLTRGNWVHRWLAAALCPVLGRFETRRRGEEITRHIRRLAAATRAEIVPAFRAAGREEPQWWRARLAQAEWLALQFGAQLAALDGWPAAAVEWNLPKGAAHAAGSSALALRGRIDVLFAPDAAAALPAKAWIADFKTGQDKPLSEAALAARLAEGIGVQLCLYALALAGAGGADLHISLLTPQAPLAPQLGLARIKEQGPFWSELARMQETGIFGIRGEVRAEYGMGLVLPIATLPVERDLLEEKWALTHAGLRAEEGAPDGD